MITPDTSVLVAGFAAWHEAHAPGVQVLNRGVRLIAHAAVETYSVLTRLPPPHRVAAVTARAYLASITPSNYLILDAKTHRYLIDRLAEHNVTGGATYDALVGLTAKAAGTTLLTRDVRAIRTYERLQVQFERIA